LIERAIRAADLLGHATPSIAWSPPTRSSPMLRWSRPTRRSARTFPWQPGP